MLQCSVHYMRATLPVPLELISRTTGATITPLFQKDMVYDCRKGGITSMFLELLFFWLPDCWARESGFVFFYLTLLGLTEVKRYYSLSSFFAVALCRLHLNWMEFNLSLLSDLDNTVSRQGKADDAFFSSSGSCGISSIIFTLLPS